MDKPYGYKEKDLIALAEFLVKGGFRGKPLSQGFKDYAAITGKAAGSVRNLYYVLAKFSDGNAEFTEKYLGGKSVKVEKSEKFSEEENGIVSKIAEFKSRGVSVRKATICLAGGDAKKALRYQNKYRNALKLSEKQKARESGAQILPTEKFLTERLKAEINKLADRLASDYKKENAKLIKQLAALKAENDRLYKRLSVQNGGVIGYFGKSAGVTGVRFLDR